jgi:type I restriction enzyme S subunit
MITSVDNAILRPDSGHDPRFLVYFMSSTPWLDWVSAICRVGGGFRLRISRTMLGNLQVLVPPPSEQRAIADALDRSTARIKRLVSKVSLSIERLREYRSALISAAVTGKIDVRGS